MLRTYEEVLKEHMTKNRQMFFLTGPRKVGKTTLILEVAEEKHNYKYFNWDLPTDRDLIRKG